MCLFGGGVLKWVALWCVSDPHAKWKKKPYGTYDTVHHQKTEVHWKHMHYPND